MAKVSFRLGPCDDTGLVSLNAKVVLTTKVNEEDSWQGDLPDGDHRVRVRLSNEGGWQWRMTFSCVVDGIEVQRHGVSGNSLGYNGMIPEAEKTFVLRIRGGKLEP